MPPPGGRQANQSDSADVLPAAIPRPVASVTQEGERYRFASASHPGVAYEITVDGADVICTCPGFEYRGQCRHARDLKAFLTGAQEGDSRFTRVS